MMRNTDKGPLVALSDVPAAIGLLTRLPARVDTELATARMHKSKDLPQEQFEVVPV